MTVNYQRELEALLASLGDNRPTLLLHSCCGPCSSHVLRVLAEHFDVTLFYYNPNIYPDSEYRLRYAEQLRLLREADFARDVKTLEAPYDPEAFDAAARGLEDEPEGGARCGACFRLRLERTAREAREGGFDYFGTTLTVSPHKNAPLLNAIGLELGEAYGVRWLPGDFKKREGYKDSIRLAAEYGLYRQDYCGCAYSLAASGGHPGGQTENTGPAPSICAGP